MMSVPRPHRRFTVDEYERMVEVGILGEDDRVELIWGEIVEMSPIGGPHVACLSRLTRAASRHTGEEIYVQVQGPIRIPGIGEPQPDLALIRAEYDQKMPPPPDAVYLVAEVADSSLEYDRGIKLPLYAAAGIPEAWLFNLVNMRIERHTDPGPSGYQTVAFAEAGQHLPSTVVPGLTFDADELLGSDRRGAVDGRPKSLRGRSQQPRSRSHRGNERTD